MTSADAPRDDVGGAHASSPGSGGRTVVTPIDDPGHEVGGEFLHARIGVNVNKHLTGESCHAPA